MSTIDVTIKDLAQQYPVYTKKGTPWPKRIDWARIEVEGTSIVTHFGTFTFLKAERINKMWYWVLKDEQGKVFRITRRQARENKRLPKSAEILDEQPEQPEDVVIPNILVVPTQLCLPAPKEPVKPKQPKSSKKGINRVAMYKDGELVQVFNSVAECKKHFNLGKSNTVINQCCNGRCKSYKGYTFKYIQEEDTTPAQPVEPTQPKHVIPSLGGPKEVIDMLLEQTIRLVTEHNNKNVTKKGTPKKSGMWITWEQVKNNFPNPFESKVNYILGVAGTKTKNLKSVYNQLANAYHPDKSHRDTNQEFAIISKFYNSYK